MACLVDFAGMHNLLVDLQSAFRSSIVTSNLFGLLVVLGWVVLARGVWKLYACDFDVVCVVSGSVGT